MDQKDFGLYFAKVREESGFRSQRQLALVSRVSNGTIARIEDGTQRAKPETLKALAPHLKNSSYEELMEKAGYLESSDSDDIYIAYRDGKKSIEVETEEEAEYLQEELEKFRAWKAAKKKDVPKNKN